MVSRAEWYSRVNGAWPESRPPLTAEEAVRAGRKLYRRFRGKPCRLPTVVTSGNRYSGVRFGELRVNPAQGWRDFVHSLSHNFYWLDSSDKPHAKSHARLELRMIKHVVRSGWLSGALKSKPRAERPPEDPRALRLQRTQAALKRWRSKARRAATAIKKLERRERALARELSRATPRLDVAGAQDVDLAV